MTCHWKVSRTLWDHCCCNVSCSLQGGTGSPGAERALGDATLSRCNKVPGNYQGDGQTNLLDQCGLRFGPVHEYSTQKRWCPPVGYTRGGLNTGILVAVSLSLSLKTHNLIFPCVPLAPLVLPPLCQSPG